jgi:hypothetical protein
MHSFSISLLFFLAATLQGASGFFFKNRHIIDPDDPLENTGDFDVKRQPTQLPLDSDTLNAEIFIPNGDGLYGFVLFMPGFGKWVEM